MDNTKLPAYPLPLVNNSEGEIRDASDWDGTNVGLTKLELASLMIAQGLVTREMQGTYKEEHLKDIASRSTNIAKAILEEANK